MTPSKKLIPEIGRLVSAYEHLTPDTELTDDLCEGISVLCRNVLGTLDKIASTAGRRADGEPPQTFAYIRVSTDRQQNSLESQQAMILKAASYLDLNVPDENILLDEARSGIERLKRRPAGAQLLKRIKSGDTLIVVAIDRIARNLRDLLRVMDDFVERNITVHIINFGGNSLNMRSAVGRLIVQLLGAVAEFERNITIERTNNVVKQRREQGVRVSKYVPPGRTQSNHITPKGDMVYVLSETEWKLMAEVYHRHDVLGESFFKIGRDFERRGVKTNNGGPWVWFHDRRKQGKGWSANIDHMKSRYRMYVEWLESTGGKEIQCARGHVLIPPCGPSSHHFAPIMATEKAKRMLAPLPYEPDSGY